MTKRTFNDKNQNQWEWEETPETIEALKQLHETVKMVNSHGGDTLLNPPYVKLP